MEDPAAKQYWSSVIDAISCIYWFRNSSNESGSNHFRYKEFPQRINRARSCYYHCSPRPQADFGMQDPDQVDKFFSEMIEDPQRLAAIDHAAAQNYDQAAPPIPLRLL